MPLQNVTIDDSSALIAYYNPNGTPWKDSPSNDTGLSGYWDNTYHSSNQTGAWSTFRFQGTAVYLYAATRWMHGRYTIFMDDQQVYQGDGHTGTSIFRQLMFNATNLSPAWHNLTFVNADPGLYIEVDYITWTTVMSAALTETSGTPIPYTLGNMTYDASIWDEDAPGSSPHMVTSTDGATVNITFQGMYTRSWWICSLLRPVDWVGHGIELYGRTGPNYGIFRTQVDDHEPREFDAYSGTVHNTILFRQDNFTDGQHTLVVTNRGNASLAIASAKPIIWSNPQDPQAESHNTWLIVGLVVGLTVGLAMLVLLWLGFARRQHAHKGVYTDNHLEVPRVNEPAYEATPFMFPPPSPSEPTTPHPPRKYSQVTQGAGYPIRYDPLPTSPGFEYYPSPTNPSPPGFDNQPGSSRLYAYSVPPIHVAGGIIRPPGMNQVQASSPQAQSPGLTVSLRDSDAGPITLPPSYSAAVVSREREQVVSSSL